MYSVEFKTKSENGIIKIPEEYGELNSKNLKVVLILEETDKKDEVDIFFSKYNIDLSAFKFNREEANER